MRPAGPFAANPTATHTQKRAIGRRREAPPSATASQKAATLATTQKVTIMSASAMRANQRYPQVVARMNPVRSAARTPNIRRARSIVMPTPAIPDSAAGSTAVSSVTLPPGSDSAAMDQMNSGVFAIRTRAGHSPSGSVREVPRRDAVVSGVLTCELRPSEATGVIRALAVSRAAWALTIPPAPRRPPAAPGRSTWDGSWRSPGDSGHRTAGCVTRRPCTGPRGYCPPSPVGASRIEPDHRRRVVRAARPRCRAHENEASARRGARRCTPCR